MDGSVLGVERDVVPLGIRAVLSSGTGNALAAWRRAELCCIVRRNGKCPESGVAGVKRVRVRADVRAEEREGVVESEDGDGASAFRSLQKMM